MTLFTPQTGAAINEFAEQAKAEQEKNRKPSKFWEGLKSFWQTAQQPAIPPDIDVVDTRPDQEDGQQTYIVAGGLMLAAVALLVYLLQRSA